MEAPEKNMPVYKDNKTGTWYVSKRYQDWDGKERRLYEELKDQENVLIIGGDKAPANALTALRLGYEAGLHA